MAQIQAARRSPPAKALWDSYHRDFARTRRNKSGSAGRIFPPEDSTTRTCLLILHPARPVAVWHGEGKGFWPSFTTALHSSPEAAIGRTAGDMTVTESVPTARRLSYGSGLQDSKTQGIVAIVRAPWPADARGVAAGERMDRGGACGWA